MKDKRFGYFDDDNREYVITDPKTLGHGLTTWAMKTSSHSSPIPPEAIPFYKDAKFRRITRYRYNNVPMDNGDATSTSTKAATYGLPPGSPARPHSTATNAATA